VLTVFAVQSLLATLISLGMFAAQAFALIDAAVRRAEPASEKVDRPDRLLEECAEQSAEVKWIVDRVAVEEYQVLIGLAAAHIEPRREIIARIHTGQQLHR